MRDWKLVVRFDTLEEQAERDPENLFPHDEGSRFIRYLTDHWGLLPEDLQDPDLVQWDGTTVTLFPEVLDYIADPVEWLLMNTIPKSLELTR